MGPMFYLVQLKEARCLISAVILADWPHEFALAILLGKRAGGGCTPWPAAQPSAEACGARGKKAWREIRAMPCRHASGPPARPAAGSDKGEKHIGLLLRQGRVFSRKLSLLCRSSVVCCRARLRRR